MLVDDLIRDLTARIHFVGIGGTGMSGYADFRALSGGGVSGSDRGFDRGQNADLKNGMIARGIKIFPQDGSGVEDAAAIVVSAAVEKTVPDYARALAQNIPIITRKAWLAAHYRAYQTVAITGTSGKSTVTAMVYEILRAGGLDPSLMTGADLKVLRAANRPGNTAVGRGPLVIEADESDKGIGDYTPMIGVILNLQRDHDEPAAILPAMQAFRDQCTRACLLFDEPGLIPLRNNRTILVGTTADDPYRVTDVVLAPTQAAFTMAGVRVTLPMPGQHNVDNAAMAFAVGLQMGLAPSLIAAALSSFQGVARRYDVLYDAQGIRVVDDYAHNPAKLAALLKTAQAQAPRVILYFQPTGFAPMRLLRADLVSMFAATLRATDDLVLAPIPFMGGTVVQDIASDDVVRDLQARGVANARVIPNRDEFLTWIKTQATSGTLIAIAGGRDATLPDFARDVVAVIKK